MAAEDELLQLLAEKGAIDVLTELSDGESSKFNALDDSLEISHTTLSRRLKRLEQANLIDREATDDHPPDVRYAITERGRAALDVVSQLREL